MPPQKAGNANAQKKPDEGKEPDEGKKPDEGNAMAKRIKQYLELRILQVPAVLIVLALLYIALLYHHLYNTESARREEEYVQTKRIHKSLMEFNDSFKYMDDIQAMMGTHEILKTMIEKQANVEDMRLALDDLVRRLKDHWILFDGHLYFFEAFKDNHSNAERSCRSKGASLPIIQSREEQAFLRKAVFERARTTDDRYWIALKGPLHDWKWLDGTPQPLETAYWNQEFPMKKYISFPTVYPYTCAYMSKKEDLYCWENDRCMALKRWICKMKLDARFL